MEERGGRGGEKSEEGPIFDFRARARLRPPSPSDTQNDAHSFSFSPAEAAVVASEAAEAAVAAVAVADDEEDEIFPIEKLQTLGVNAGKTGQGRRVDGRGNEGRGRGGVSACPNSRASRDRPPLVFRQATSKRPRTPVTTPSRRC